MKLIVRLAMLLAVLLGVFAIYGLSTPIGELLGKTIEIRLKDGKTYQGLVIAETEDAIILKGRLREDSAGSKGPVSEIQIPRAEIAEVRLLPQDVIRDMLFWLGIAAVISGLVIMIFWGFD